MHSKLLKDAGLNHQLFGLPYDFRFQKIGDEKSQEQIAFIFQELGLDPKTLYTCHQTHSNHVIDLSQREGASFILGTIFDDADGMLTNRSGDTLLIKHADCTPILLFDPVNKVHVSIHSGWRGTAQRISQVGIQMLVDQYHCQLENILAYVGPSIEQDAYQVGKEVYDAFATFDNRDLFFAADGDRFKLNMSKANALILLEAGLKSENIDVETRGTFYDKELHSARREGAEYGLNALISWMV